MSRNAILATAAVCTLMVSMGLIAADKDTEDVPAALNFKMKNIDGEEVNLAEKYKGKVVLMVNVASKCGFTPQYTGLEGLHDKYAKKGLAVVGFPCNQFGKQEPGSAAQIKAFCAETYKVEFDLFSKIDVNGPESAPLYKYLTSDEVPVADKGAIKWNFEKFLVGRDGNVVARYRSRTTPAQIVADIERELAKSAPAG